MDVFCLMLLECFQFMATAAEMLVHYRFIIGRMILGHHPTLGNLQPFVHNVSITDDGQTKVTTWGES
jgi:hypothetical protein